MSRSGSDHLTPIHHYGDTDDCELWVSKSQGSLSHTHTHRHTHMHTHLSIPSESLPYDTHPQQPLCRLPVFYFSCRGPSRRCHTGINTYWQLPAWERSSGTVGYLQRGSPGAEESWWSEDETQMWARCFFQSSVCQLFIPKFLDSFIIYLCCTKVPRSEQQDWLFEVQQFSVFHMLYSCCSWNVPSVSVSTR